MSTKDPAPAPIPDSTLKLIAWWLDYFDGWGGYIAAGVLLKLRAGKWGLETLDGATRLPLSREMAVALLTEHVNQPLAPPRSIAEAVALMLIGDAEKAAARN